MSRYVNRFWIWITIFLSVVFAALFVPVAARNIGLGKAILYTLIGLIVIWMVYLIRAHIFGRLFSKKGKEKA